MDSSHWAELLLSGKALPGPVVARIANLPAVPLYAFAQDLYAGSGFELSKFESQEPDEAGQAQIKKILGRKQVFFFLAKRRCKRSSAANRCLLALAQTYF